jgi:type VI secretion system protein ImpA
MASPDVLDFASLLSPIAGDDPAGVDIRADASPGSLYYLIKDARSAARAAERRLPESDADAARADWRPVLKHGRTALAERTKDLEVTAYVIEALIRLHGLAGLRDGFKLGRCLVEQFWDGLYPRPDDDGIDTRVAPLTSLNGEDADGTLIAPIAQVPVTEGGSTGPFASYHYHSAAALEQLDPEAREKRIQQGAVTLAQLEKAASETSVAFFVNLVEDLKACQSEFGGLCAALDARCDGRAPPASNIRGALTACLDAVLALARDKLPRDLAGEEPADGIQSGAAGGNGRAAPGETFRQREEALQSLLKVAEFFRRTEPHNPVSYALEQAVRWSRMTLPELLVELIPDESSRGALFKQVGIRPPAGPS